MRARLPVCGGPVPVANRALLPDGNREATTHTNARHCYSAKLPTLREMPQNASVYQTDGIAFS